MQVTFDAEFKGINTGRTLGEDRGGAVLCKLVFEGNAMDLELDQIKLLQKAGLVTVTVSPKQLDLTETKPVDDRQGELQQ